VQYTFAALKKQRIFSGIKNSTY